MCSADEGAAQSEWAKRLGQVGDSDRITKEAAAVVLMQEFQARQLEQLALDTHPRGIKRDSSHLPGSGSSAEDSDDAIGSRTADDSELKSGFYPETLSQSQGSANNAHVEAAERYVQSMKSIMRRTPNGHIIVTDAKRHRQLKKQYYKDTGNSSRASSGAVAWCRNDHHLTHNSPIDYSYRLLVSTFRRD